MGSVGLRGLCEGWGGFRGRRGGFCGTERPGEGTGGVLRGLRGAVWDLQDWGKSWGGSEGNVWGRGCPVGLVW